MAKFVIEGGIPLSGTVTPSGNKNAAFPLMAACLLTDEPVILHNLPDIGDVETMGKLLSSLGVSVDQIDLHNWRLQAREVRASELPSQLFGHIRGSVTLAGPILARTGTVRLPRPGGDMIGRRRMDTHFLALNALGAEVDIDGAFCLRGERLHGADILLDQASVTATENAIMAAVLAEGTTVIRNAACEPHVQDLCQMLCQFGAQIGGVGSNTLTIQGVERLSGGEYTIGADYMEVGSYIALAAATGGELLIKDAAPEHLRMVALVFDRLGVRFEVRGRDVFVPADQSLEIVPDADGAIPEISDAASL
jgi:UDP-N-acetylglucosamine 1-carboxyvinyltransferase